MLKPDSTRYPAVVQPRASGPEWTEIDSAEAAAESHHGQAFRSKGDLPSDVALDLRLHEILQQARLTTAASGAVVALARGDRMVCRATLGEKAPSVGVSMNTRSGLSGACVQSREMQLCDDSLADPRVNAIACRDLGIRSIVVLPVLNGGELWGVLEVFSSVPRAFSDSDLQSLQSLTRKISRTVQDAIEAGSSVLAPVAELQPPLAPESPPATLENTVPLDPSLSGAGLYDRSQPDEAPVSRDYRTGILTAAVLALAVLLGWMVGRVGWSMAVNRAPIQIPLGEPPPTTSRAIPETPPVTPLRNEAALPKTSKADLPVSARPARKPRPQAAEPAELSGGLVVYEHGKVVFRMPPTQAEAPAIVQPKPGPAADDAIKEAATREPDGLDSPLAGPAPSGSSYLLERVEPAYPEAARAQHIQGPVLLHVLVGADGLVRDLKVISGDPQLAEAATNAVRQWRFKPHQLKGKAVEFETRIKVNFALSE